MTTRRHGFTLFEVLAAVAVLGLVYVSLARAAMEGLRAEGESARRLDASLLADQALSDLELLVAAGVTPEVGITETESADGAYQIVVEVAPYSLDALAATARPGAEPAGAVRELPLLVATRSGATTALLSMTVAVRWQEGIYDREVTRASFAFDAVAAAPLLAAIAGAEDGDGGDEDDGELDEDGAGAGDDDAPLLREEVEQ